MFDHDKYIAKRAAFNRILVRERGIKFLESLKAKDSRGRIQINYANGEHLEGSAMSVSPNPTSTRFYQKLASTSFNGPPVSLNQVMDEVVREYAPSLGFKKTEIRDDDGRLTSVVIRPRRQHRASRS